MFSGSIKWELLGKNRLMSPSNGSKCVRNHLRENLAKSFNITCKKINISKITGFNHLERLVWESMSLERNFVNLTAKLFDKSDLI